MIRAGRQEGQTLWWTTTTTTKSALTLMSHYFCYYSSSRSVREKKHFVKVSHYSSVFCFFRYGKEKKNAALAHLASNINARDVRGGNFQLPLDQKGQLGELSFNKSQAYTILAPPEDFQGKHYKHILDNVCMSGPLTLLFNIIIKLLS